MASGQITARWPTIKPSYNSQAYRQHSMPYPRPTCTKNISETFPKLAINASHLQRCTPVCISGGRGKSKDDKEGAPWNPIETAMGSFKKEQSVEELLRKQIENQEYYDDRGSSGNPPGGGGDDYGRGDGVGEPEDGGEAGVMDELLQVILATLGFIFVYIYIIKGAEINRLTKDYLKYIFTGTKSIRLTRAMYVWKRLVKRLKRKKVPEDPYWLEKEIINTPTWFDSPEKYRRIIRDHYRRSPPDDVDSEE